ncbi:MAG TPA: TraB/GumN family protein [Candidatus Thermoplasmatota archaeon]|nr:TraB/GumN family protein [Candidatus Thermoplasmatota archaeon]
MEEKISDNIILIGTAHISEESVNEVRKAIETYKPDIVAVELCQRRFETISKKDKWENTPVTALIKSNNAYFMLAQTFLSSIQRRLGEEYGVEPGSEMIAAMQEAEKYNIKVALVDRDITVTLKRAWRAMGLREKFKVVWEFLKAMIGYDEEELEELDLKELMKQDVLSSMMEEFSKIAPSAAKVLITERDLYIAQKIFEESKKGKVVAVVGAGHVNGIKKHLEKQELHANLQELEQIPKKRLSLVKVVEVAIPVIFFAVIGWIIYSTGVNPWNKIKDIFLIWFLVHGILAGVGVAIARGHPLSILTAFLAAPFTSLEPFFAPGWFAGLVEAKLRKPLIKDFQELSKIERVRDFLKNKVIRLLMVVALANLGSIIGTIVALPWILSLGLG